MPKEGLQWLLLCLTYELLKRSLHSVQSSVQVVEIEQESKKFCGLRPEEWTAGMGFQLLNDFAVFWGLQVAYSATFNNNNDRLTAFDPGQPG